MTLRLRKNRGVTVLELAVVIVIIGILACMLLPVAARIQSRADEATCIANLKNLFVGAAGYLHDKESWPQIPNTLLKDDPKGYAKQWVAALSRYGIPHKAWICPAIQRERHEPMSTIEDDETYRVDYIGMAFDDRPTSPKPENPFPWFVESAGFHGRGNLIILSDGNTTSLNDMVGARGGN